MAEQKSKSRDSPFNQGELFYAQIQQKGVALCITNLL